MTLKKLNKNGMKPQTIHTGFFVYIYMTEKWKRAIYNGIKTEFYVSTLGRVYNIKKKKFSKLNKKPDEYIYVQSRYKGKRTSIFVHKLVLETFKGPPNKSLVRPECDHIDGNVHNNYINNLQWLSQKDNLNKRILSNQKGDNNSYSKYTSEIILKIADMLSSGKMSITEISEEMSIPKSTISGIKNKQRWTHLLEDYNFDNVPKSKNKVITKNNYSDDEIINVANLILENKSTLTEISKNTGIPYYVVKSIKDKNKYKDILEKYNFDNFNSYRSTLTKEQIKAVDELVNSNYTPKEIAKKLNIEYSTKIRNAIYERRRKQNKK